MAHMNFEKESSRVYKEVDKFSNLQWVHRDLEELIKARPGQKRTRSQAGTGAPESKEWFKNTDAQFGYGEITKGAMSSVLDLFQNISSHENLKDVGLPSNTDFSYYDMKAQVGSTFLDIGAGFGKPVFHAAMQTGCQSYGIEIVPARVAFCADQKCQFMDYYDNERSTASETHHQQKTNGDLQMKKQSSVNVKKHDAEVQKQNSLALKALKEMTKQSNELISSMEDYNEMADQALDQQISSIAKKHIAALVSFEQDLQQKIDKKKESKKSSVNKDATSSSEKNALFAPREHTINYIPGKWINLCNFELIDAAKDISSYKDNDGKDISHIYSYNKVMSAKDLEGICKILNQTNFRVLAWYQDPRTTEKAGLKNFKVLHRMPMHSTGNEKFSCYIYLKETDQALASSNGKDNNAKKAQTSTTDKNNKEKTSIAQKKRSKK